MILNFRTDQEHDDLLSLMRVINLLRNDSHLHRPIVDDTPWCRVVKPNPKYL